MTAAPAYAQQDAENLSPDPDNVRIFVAGAAVPSYVGGKDYKIIPAIQLRGTVAGFNFETVGTATEVDVVRDNGKSIEFQLGPLIGVNLDRTTRLHGRSNARVNALGKRKRAVEIGGYAGVAKTGVATSAYDVLAFGISWQKDVAGAHRSYIVTPSLEYGTPLSKRTYLDVRFTADIVGDKYAAYYFDVSPAGSVASGLPRFAAKGGLQDIGVVLTGLQSLSGDLRRGWSLVGMGGYTRLVGDTKRSPIVAIAGSSGQWTGALGVSYVFK
ncbi:MipA/OmpV family protein [Sphingomonas sp. M1-B02]|uniref:MipA/OmpV family protein n=1 Tax=Sphingomonas sp. M1-B02 TaxID=3114300 RepID=UPI002240C544|nr:MipA/OmpV family protein [Sphingomonas sp. S6-11]UZK66294.1 MipA/OmpV family protein [Sphingomonas sp. S6-11]